MCQIIQSRSGGRGYVNGAQTTNSAHFHNLKKNKRQITDGHKNSIDLDFFFSPRDRVFLFDELCGEKE
jgi:hypothetical protein